LFLEWREEEIAKINATKQGAGKRKARNKMIVMF